MTDTATQSTILHSHYLDGGPLYTETDFHHTVAEPWNGATALVFLALAAYWAWRERQLPQRSFGLRLSFALLAIGGVGGALFHALRVSRLFYAMDIIPIALLCGGWSLYLWKTITPRYRQLAWVLPLGLVLQRACTVLFNRQVAITVDYAVLAVCLVSPFLLRWRTLGRDARRSFLVAIGLFAIAATCRGLDPYVAAQLTHGTHWLWHLLGAVAVHFFLRSLVAWKFSATEGTTSGHDLAITVVEPHAAQGTSGAAR